MDLYQMVMKRRSVRTFSETDIPAVQLDELKRVAHDAFSPFGGHYMLQVVSTDAFASHVPSTYGVIKGARNFMLLWCETDNVSLLSGGFAMEQMVLEATSLQLGTCWIGGTFSAKDFEICRPAGAGELKLVAVVPVGVPAQRERLLGRIMPAMVGSRGRKPFNQLFSMAGGEPVSEEEPYYQLLELMRAAPSSTNSQPWRAVVCHDGVEFYKAKSGPLSDIDMGIGLCHFYLGSRQNERRGHFVSAPPSHPVKPGWHYVTTFVNKTCVCPSPHELP